MRTRFIATAVAAALTLSATWLVPSVVCYAWAEQEPVAAAVTPGFGEVLFAYWQGDHQTALAKWQAAEQRGELVSQPAALLIKGASSLALGMWQQAQQIFEQVLAQEPNPQVRAKAWLLLAQSWYHRADFEQAATTLANVTGQDLSGQDAAQWHYYQGQLALRNGDMVGANQALIHLQALELQQSAAAEDEQVLAVEHTQYSPYLQHNVLLAQLANQSTSAETLTSILATPLRDEQQLWLRDRSLLALADNWLQHEQLQLAAQAFAAVSQQGDQQHAALLGYGWALAKSGQQAAAMAVMAELAEQRPMSMYVQQAHLAQSYWLAQAGQWQQAEQQLQHSLMLFGERAQQLTQLQQQAIDWPNFELAEYLKQHPQAELPDWLAAPQFQQLWQQYQELRDTASTLAEQQQQLQSFWQLQQERAAELLQRYQDFTQLPVAAKVAVLTEQQQQLTAQWQQLQGDATQLPLSQLLALATDEERQLYQRLQQAQSRWQRLAAADKAPATAQRRLVRVEQLLRWQILDDWPTRKQQAHKALAQLAEAKLQLQQQQQQLSGSMQAAISPNAIPQQLLETRQRLQTLQQQTNELLLAQQQQLQHYVAAFYQQQQQQLQEAQFNGRWQLVQLQERLLQAPDPAASLGGASE